MYDRKTLLELSKSVKFEVIKKPDTRRSAMTYLREEQEAKESAKMNSGLRHRQRPSMDLIRQLPSRNPDLEGERSRSSTLHSKSNSRKRKNKARAIATGGTIGTTSNLPDDQLADRIYEALKDEIDEGHDVVDAEQYGTTLLRNMKHSLQVKRKVKARLVSFRSDKPKNIGCHKRFWYKMAMFWSRMRNSAREVGQQMELWHSHIHRIEGNFGSSVVSYFYFLRFLLYINLILVFLTTTFLFIPQILYRLIQAHVPYSNTSFSGKELLTGTGWFEGTELYYSGYTNNTIELFSGYYYELPDAYILTAAANFVIMLIILAVSLASSHKKNFVITSEPISKSLPIKVFCGWDHQIASDDAADLKHKALFNEISLIMTQLTKETVPDDCFVKMGHFVMRLGINVIILVMMLGTWLIVYFLLERESLNAEVPVIGEMVLAITITAVNLVFPLICSTMVEWEEYKSKQAALYLTLIRTFIMQSVILGILSYFWLKFSTDEWQHSCWEGNLGQEFYRLVIVYLIFIIILTLFTDWVRKVIAKYFPSVGRAEFDIATNTLNLIYIQTLCWLGMFFSPLLPIIVVIVLVIVFYVKRYSTSWNCQPSPKPWKAAHAHTVFLSLSLLSLLLCIVAICYAVLMAHPSAICGPFCHQQSMYSVALLIIQHLISIQIVGHIFAIFSTPAVVGSILILMSIFVYYLSAMARAHQEMTELLRKQLILESKDKVFLLRWFESTMRGSVASSAETVKVQQVDETAQKSGIKAIPGVGALASGLGQVASGVTDVGSKVGKSVLKLKNVMNPIYRDGSRKDQEMKYDMSDVPPLQTAAPESAQVTIESNNEEVATKVAQPKTVVTPPAVQHSSAFDRLRQMSPPGAMTPDQQKMRNMFGRSPSSSK